MRNILTPREAQILQLYAEGLKGPQIAEELDISFGTVRTHAQNALVALGAHSMPSAIWRAHLLGYLTHGLRATG